jgi:putative membrane protein
MRDLIRNSLLNSFSLFAVAAFYPGLIVPQQLQQLLWAGVIFSLINALVKPIVKLFLLPINLITLGLFRWLANVLILLVLTRIIDTISVISFISPPISQAGFAIPSLNINLAVSYILASFLLSFVFNLLDNLLTQD